MFPWVDTGAVSGASSPQVASIIHSHSKFLLVTVGVNGGNGTLDS
jgi:hypothetical protein